MLSLHQIPKAEEGIPKKVTKNQYFDLIASPIKPERAPSKKGHNLEGVISQNGNNYTIGNNLSYYQCGASENHEHGNEEHLNICKITSTQ